MKRFLRQALRWTAILLAMLGALLLVFYAEEDWRGARDWAACQRDLAAKGETLDLRQLVPPGKPEDDLSKVPIFAELYQQNDEYQKTRKSTINPRIQKIKTHLKPSNDGYVLPKSTHYTKSEAIDLLAWQKYYRATPEAHLPEQVGTPAQDVLRAFDQFDSDLKEIDFAVSNPKAYWPVSRSGAPTYAGGYIALTAVAQVLQLKAVAYLDSHESQLAENEYQFILRFTRSLDRGDFLNYLVAAAIRDNGYTVLWEGLRRHAWNDEQLRNMESVLASTDMLAFGAESLRLNRASLLEAMGIYQSNHVDVVNTAVRSNVYYFFRLDDLPISRLRPNGWWNQDRTNLCRDAQEHLNAINSNAQTLDVAMFPRDPMWNRTDRDETIGKSMWQAIYTPFSSLAIDAFNNEGFDIARAETYRRLARLACRLEEYRLAHNNQYPDKLDDLPDLPAHLNQEVLSEQPLHYQRKGDGYLLYSLGWNQKDDGGIYSADVKEGDWVWPSP